MLRVVLAFSRQRPRAEDNSKTRASSPLLVSHRDHIIRTTKLVIASTRMVRDQKMKFTARSALLATPIGDERRNLDKWNMAVEQRGTSSAVGGSEIEEKVPWLVAALLHSQRLRSLGQVLEKMAGCCSHDGCHWRCSSRRPTDNGGKRQRHYRLSAQRAWSYLTALHTRCY